jgi:hypothetical protein
LGLTFLFYSSSGRREREGKRGTERVREGGREGGRDRDERER